MEFGTTRCLCVGDMIEAECLAKQGMHMDSTDLKTVFVECLLALHYWRRCLCSQPSGSLMASALNTVTGISRLARTFSLAGAQLIGAYPEQCAHSLA